MFTDNFLVKQLTSFLLIRVSINLTLLRSTLTQMADIVETCSVLVEFAVFMHPVDDLGNEKTLGHLLQGSCPVKMIHKVAIDLSQTVISL